MNFKQTNRTEDNRPEIERQMAYEAAGFNVLGIFLEKSADLKIMLSKGVLDQGTASSTQLSSDYNAAYEQGKWATGGLSTIFTPRIFKHMAATNFASQHVEEMRRRRAEEFSHHLQMLRILPNDMSQNMDLILKAIQAVKAMADMGKPQVLPASEPPMSWPASPNQQEAAPKIDPAAVDELLAQMAKGNGQ